MPTDPVGGTRTRSVSIYFDITGGRDYRDIAPHFHEAHVDQDLEVIGADRYYFRALALYVVQRPAKANSVLELKTGKAWFRHFPFAFSPGRVRLQDIFSRLARLLTATTDRFNFTETR